MAELPDPSTSGVVASMARKKFATPPVKIACLSCRSSRTRCNGENPCASCASKDRPCIYKPSRRGGPRVRKKPRYREEFHEQPPPLAEPVAELPSNPLPVENFINPGAGLKNLNDIFQDSDVLFDTLFMPENSLPDTPLEAMNQSEPMVRTYSTDSAILNAYYIWIHPYFPILPPPSTPLTPDDEVVPIRRSDHERGVEVPSTPIALALSAILALIPCAQDGNSLAEDSVLFRRTFAQFLAQTAFESIDGEAEKPESAVEPPRALDDSDDEIFREQFHPNVPVELESIIALDIMSVYEYSQRGNLKKMRNRASSALVAAMTLSLHVRADEEDGYSEARRRVWWMTYICLCQSSIVGNVHPAFEVFTPTYTTKEFPTITSDPGAWPAFLKAQQAILTATQFVIELNKTMQVQGDMVPIYQQMTELERLLEPLITESDTWRLNCPLTQPVDSDEAVVAQALRCMAIIKLNSARIKVHRYCAFFDLPVFSGKHCDLKPKQEKVKGSQDLQLWPSCCSAIGGNGKSSSGHSGASSSSPTLSMRSTPNSDGAPHHQSPSLALVFPFSSHQSAKICLKSAFNIAQGFESLPYPNPTAQLCEPPCYLGPGSTVITPRTMPSFACCAMQCAYVLLMVHEKTQNMYPGWGNESGVLVSSLLQRLQQGLLSILATLENYGMAFEALGGMRDQIRDKVYSSIVFET